jgi:crotonobetainyl-CoA:carnitine CoA-transferase CaiB-like acyl-CoA transferase
MTRASRRTGPLSDLRILDLTQALAGPYGTALLADLGADVIKIEPPSGDMARVVPPYPKHYAHPLSDPATDCDYGGYFASINRNKRSVVLDLKTDGDRETFLKMVEKADAVTENARVGVMEKLGIGYEALRGRNPKIVYAAIRGFGDPRTGESPYAEWPAFDIVAQCMGGLVGITGPTDSLGYPNGSSIGDIFPGTLMALGLVAAVHHARLTGEGQFLDVSMYDAVMSMAETAVVNYSYDRRILGRRGAGHPHLCPFDVYEAADGAVAIAAPTPNHWLTLCEIIGRLDLVEDERTSDTLRRTANRDFVTGIVSAWTRRHTKREIVEALGGRVPVGPVNTAADLFDDPHTAARGTLPEVELPGDNGRVALVGTPIKFTRTEAGIYDRPPSLGEHSEEVLAELDVTRKGRDPEPGR